MGWDRKLRGNGRGYFYRSVRVGVQVKKIYLGRGQYAEAEARQIADRQRAQHSERDAREHELARLVTPDRLLAELHRIVGALVDFALHDVGYHNHRGEYRRRRHAGEKCD